MSNPPPQPNLQVTISALFRLFLEFTHARSPERKAELERQIIALFESTGASGDLSITEAQKTFERLRAVPTEVVQRVPTSGELAREFATYSIRILERASDNPKLSGPAHQMLRIPLKEYADTTGYFDQDQIESSLSQLYASMREPPPSETEGKGRLRTSLAVIRAFAQNYCRIPPFCAPRNHDNRS